MSEKERRETVEAAKKLRTLTKGQITGVEIVTVNILTTLLILIRIFRM